ncbi:hypothetical protein [Spiroplasma citri]|uniref:Hypothetical transmembrane protein n=1 Tax=Spiroplasma citri TaxID=2133 RepID=Q14KR0_SPICI|nr:hypothetical protein [Spiroplasma citri]APE74138.1 hypothetical protein SCITRI_00224 [Spiroplasma citri]QIA66396.1 hypothetical protein GMI18_01065 [Spiroplasma citri]QIA68273.1 hypothetical protein GL298_01180 [Spiroplasma citri]QIA70148.1 hypothetical protein GL981_01185 [Spiroplasma citri]QIA72353.1 hypothetical protein GL982_01050 [Spiroplasma citri]
MDLKEYKSEILLLIRKVFIWGLGAILIISAIVLFFCKVFKVIEIDWPEYFYIGLSLLITGSFIYLIDKVFDFFKKEKKDSIEDVIKKEDTK